MPDCTVQGCDREAESGPHCPMHKKRVQRGVDLSQRVQEKLTPFARFVEACIALADAPAESDPAFDLALDVARKASQSWMRSLGWRPPTEVLAESVSRVVQTPPREQGQSSASQAAGRQAVRKGHVGKSEGPAELGARDASARAEARAVRDRDAAPADAHLPEGRSPTGRRVRHARPRGSEAVQHRARKARREAP